MSKEIWGFRIRKELADRALELLSEAGTLKDIIYKCEKISDGSIKFTFDNQQDADKAAEYLDYCNQNPFADFRIGKPDTSGCFVVRPLF